MGRCCFLAFYAANTLFKRSVYVGYATTAMAFSKKSHSHEGSAGEQILLFYCLSRLTVRGTLRL